MDVEELEVEQTAVQKVHEYIRDCTINSKDSGEQLSEELLKAYLSECTRTELNELLISGSWYTFEVLKIIIEAGADPRTDDDILLNIVIYYNDHARLIPYLLELGLDPNKNDTFAEACGHNYFDLECIKMMLDYGAIITDYVIVSVTRSHKVDVMKILIEYGAKAEDFFKSELMRRSRDDERIAGFLRFMATDEIDHIGILKKCADEIDEIHLRKNSRVSNGQRSTNIKDDIEDSEESDESEDESEDE